MEILLEICVDTLESAIAAIEGGADRIELCSALSEGGLTPTVGLLRAVKKFLTKWSTSTGRTVPVFCMVRCRRGSDFQYSESEMEIMLWDVQLLKENGADGFVFGALDASGNVNRGQCEEMVKAINKTSTFPLTFHRAIDCTNENELRANVELIAQLGFTTVLTSGLRPSAIEGVDTIMQMRYLTEEIKKVTKNELQIMPGSGVTPENVQTILTTTGCSAIHGSASIPKLFDNPNGRISMGGTNVDALPQKVCSKDKVAELRRLIKDIRPISRAK